MRVALLVIALVAWHARDAHAIRGCVGADGWAPRQSETLPRHPHLVYWSDGRNPGPGGLEATIDGKPVVALTRVVDAAPYKLLVVVEINSEKTGTLELHWKASTQPWFTATTATYQIVAKTTYPKHVHGKTSRYQRMIPHSAAREVFAGLAIAIDAPAILAHVKLRRDAKAPWVELDVPVADGGIRIGQLGCVQNYTPALLEGGVDLRIELTRPDGAKVALDVPARVAIPKLAKPTGDIPWDAE